MSCLFPRCPLQARASQAAQAAHGKPFSGTFSVPENQIFELKSYSTLFKKYFRELTRKRRDENSVSSRKCVLNMVK